jgi:site-specific recombinase XerC
VSAVEYEAAQRAASPPAALAMLLAQEAGLRAGAIASLCRHNLDFKEGVMRGKTKGGANYNVPMTARVRERLLWVAAQAEPEEPLVAAISYRRGAQSVRDLDYHVRQAKRRAGVDSAWTLHDLRRSAARRVYERTRDVRKVQRVLSHKNLSTTMWYLGDGGTDVKVEDLEPIRKDRTNP